MTEDIQRLADMAANIWEEAVHTGDVGFAISIGDDEVEFFSPGKAAYAGYCRACIASLEDTPFPEPFAEEALKGNFFWRGTNGATISYEKGDNTIWLTDRFDEGAFEDERALRDYVDQFLGTLDAWRARLSLCLTENTEAKEA